MRSMVKEAAGHGEGVLFHHRESLGTKAWAYNPYAPDNPAISPSGAKWRQQPKRINSVSPHPHWLANDSKARATTRLHRR